MAPRKRSLIPTEDSLTETTLNSNSTLMDIVTEVFLQNVTVADRVELWNSTQATPTHCPDTENVKDSGLNNYHIIKVGVLVIVTVIIMFSICKMVFQIFVRYAGKQDDRWTKIFC